MAHAQGVSSGRHSGYHSFFSNCVPGDTAPRLVAALCSPARPEPFRFQLVDTKSRASAHVINQVRGWGDGCVLCQHGQIDISVTPAAP